MKSRAAQAFQNARSKLRNKDPKLATALDGVRLDWYTIRNTAGEDTTEIYIYDEIMPQWLAEWFGGGVSAEGMIAQLNEITTANIDVRINSPGGAVFEAIAIYNALVKHPANINVYVDSLAASAASVIAMAGDKLTMMVGSQMMIHDAMGLEMGNARDLREYATFLDKQSDNIASIYADRAGGEVKQWRALMIAETWMFANEAVEMGLADVVYSRPVGAPDPEPAPDMEPEEEEEGTEEGGDEDTETVDDDELADLMSKTHLVAASRYGHRRRAPAPVPVTAVTDEQLDRYIETFRNLLGGK